MKIQTKISLIFTILNSGIILALSIFIYIFGSESVSNSFYHRLEVRADIVGHAALQKSKSTTSIYYDIKERHLGDLPFEQHHIIKDGEVEKAKKLKTLSDEREAKLKSVLTADQFKTFAANRAKYAKKLREYYEAK